MRTLPYVETPAQVIETRDKLERKYDCYIFLYQEDDSVYMSVIAKSLYRCHMLLLASKADVAGISAAMEEHFKS